MTYLSPPANVPATGRVVLGLDPGLQRTGYAVMLREGKAARLLEGGVLRTRADQTLSERLGDLASGLREVLREYCPAVAAVEQAIAHDRNFRSSLLVAQVRGALLLTLADAGVPVMQYAPTEVKRLLTGSGRANKEQVQAAVQMELRLEKILEPHDVADASALALCLSHQVRFAA